MTKKYFPCYCPSYDDIKRVIEGMIESSDDLIENLCELFAEVEVPPNLAERAWSAAITGYEVAGGYVICYKAVTPSWHSIINWRKEYRPGTVVADYGYGISACTLAKAYEWGLASLSKSMKDFRIVKLQGRLADIIYLDKSTVSFSLVEVIEEVEKPDSKVVVYSGSLVDK